MHVAAERVRAGLARHTPIGRSAASPAGRVSLAGWMWRHLSDSVKYSAPCSIDLYSTVPNISHMCYIIYYININRRSRTTLLIVYYKVSHEVALAPADQASQSGKKKERRSEEETLSVGRQGNRPGEHLEAS